MLPSSTVECCCLILITIVHLILPAESTDFPSANVSTRWVNHPQALRQSVEYINNLRVRTILLKSPQGAGTRYSLAFYRNATQGHLLAVVMVNVNSGGGITSPTDRPPAVWFANRNFLVGENATLTFTDRGDLVLADERNVPVWSTNTSDKGVVTMELLGTGNLVLLDNRNQVVWQSFDHPADALLPGQTLIAGMSLTSAVSPQDPSPGPYTMEMKPTGLFLYARASPPQPYWSRKVGDGSTPNTTTPSMLYVNGSMLLFVKAASAAAFAASQSTFDADDRIAVSTAAEGEQYLKLDPDGTLRLYQRFKELDNVLYGAAGQQCGLPGSCGEYGFCSDSGACSCSYANSQTEAPIVERVQKRPELGCSPSTALTCGLPSGADHYLKEVTSVDYFALENLDKDQAQAVNSSDDCKRNCLESCSCKAAFLQVNFTVAGSPRTICYTANEELYTMRSALYSRNSQLNTTAFIKLQKLSSKSSSKTRTVLLAVLLPLTFTVTVTAILIAVIVHRKKVAEQEEQLLDAMPGLPKRFSYEELCAATSNFSKKLGRGGFGSVFQGTLPDGSQVAVKRLESAVQGHKEFRAEVVTIGSIHHVNLVQLRGFCAETDHRLLVYEHVANGSLDKWLFRNSDSETAAALSWEVRVRIALGTARGLAYLHEECRHRIIHLDIKPENILLDERFDAKVCDFGMSKLMKREESEVFTMMRGTRGYLAPEWLQSSITEKVDVYSFGVVLLELVSGQRCLDNDRVVSSQRYFPSWANHLAEQDRLIEIIDKQLHQKVESIQEQAIVLVRLALHCLQEDPVKRPSMGSLVQMLEQLMINSTYVEDEYPET